MATKKSVSLVFIIPIFMLFLSSCSKNQSDYIWTWEYPDAEEFSGIYEDMYGYPDGAEQDYDNLIVYMEQDVYPTNADILIGYIKNTNPGKGFYNWQYAFVEKLEDGQWVQLYYHNENIFRTLGWGYAGYEPPLPELQYEGKKKYWMKYVVGEVEPGQYRMVFFAGPKVLYAPFEFVFPEEYEELYPEGYTQTGTNNQ